MTVSSITTPAAAPLRLLYPLDIVYRRAGARLPGVDAVSAQELPDPERALLEHDGSMTRMLERHFGENLVLRTLSTLFDDERYFRHILLTKAGSDRPVEMAAVRLMLQRFSPSVREQIVRLRAPLGRVLDQGGVQYRSVPRRFLAVHPDAGMMAVFRMAEARTVYGRQTDLLSGEQCVGHIIEILTPECQRRTHGSPAWGAS